MIIFISLGMMQCKEKEPSPIDYRDKWCGTYDFYIYLSDKITHSVGKVFYLKSMPENKLNIDLVKTIYLDYYVTVNVEGQVTYYSTYDTNGHYIYIDESNSEDLVFFTDNMVFLGGKNFGIKRK